MTENKIDLNFAQDLAFFANEFIEEIRVRLFKNAKEIYDEKIIVKLLSEYRRGKLNDINELADSLYYSFIDDNKEPYVKDSCLNNTSSYRNVLYNLLIK